MDSRESSDLSPIKIPNKITNPENKRQFSMTAEVATNAV